MKQPTTQPTLILPTLAILGTVLFWGMSFVSTKAILNTGVPPMTMAFLRFLCASIILFPLLKKIEPTSKVDKKDRPSLILSGLFGVTIYFYFETTGIKMTSASSASLIIATIPVFTIMVEHLFYKNRVTWLKGAGVVLSILGVYFIIQKTQSTEAAPHAMAGNLLMLGACICWVIYIMFSKNLKNNFSGLSLTTYQAFYGALFLLPLALTEYRSWVPVPWSAWLNILYLALFCTAVSFFLYIYALSQLGPIIISSYVNLIPLVGVAGGVILLGEQISYQQVLGGLVIILGVFLVNYKKRAALKEPEPSYPQSV